MAKLIIYGLKKQLRRQQPVSRVALALGAMGAGAAAMYVFDPARGRRRRAALRDTGVRLLHKTQD